MNRDKINKIKTIVEPFIKDNRGLIGSFIALTFLSYPLESIVVPGIFGSFFANVRNKNFDFKTFALKALLFTLIVSTANSGSDYINSQLIPKFNSYITNYIYEKILLGLKNSYRNIETSKIITRLNTLPNIIREITSDLFTWLVPRIITFITITIYFFYKNIKLGILSLSLFYGTLHFNISGFSECSGLSKKRYCEFERKNERFQDKLSNLFSIYTMGNTNDEINDNKKQMKQYEKSLKQFNMCTSNLKFTNNFAQLSMFLGLNGFIINLYNNAEIDLESMISLNMMVNYYISCVLTIVGALPGYTNHIGVLEELDAFLSEISGNTSTSTGTSTSIDNWKIEVKNLTFSFNESGKTIFNDLNLRINSGDHVAITGDSGRGKSTLLKIIMGLYPIESNKVFIDGHDITELNMEKIRENIIFVDQNSKLFNKTVLENICYGNSLTKDQVISMYYKYNLSKIFGSSSVDDVLEMRSGVGGENLSGGQKQIVQILRAYGKSKIVQGNKLFIFDEPTASLDPESKGIACRVINDLISGSTSITISHEIKYIEKNINKNIKI